MPSTDHPRPSRRRDPARSRFTRVADASPDSIWILSPEGAIVCMNSAAEALAPSGSDPTHWRHIWPIESRVSAGRAIAAAAAGRAWKFRSRRLAADGQAIYLDTTVSPVRRPSGEIEQLL